MKAPGRPKNAQRSVHLAIAGWLNPEYDADLIAWLESIPKGQRMQALKTALRSGGLGANKDSERDSQDEIQSAADNILSNWEF
jgi:hypothetical protein